MLPASGGAEALALLAAGEAVDILVTDLSMPGMDGLAVIRAVQERRAGLPAVLLTGYAGDGAALALGGRGERIVLAAAQAGQCREFGGSPAVVVGGAARCCAPGTGARVVADELNGAVSLACDLENTVETRRLRLPFDT